jgi:hypothetical protein
MHLPRSAALVVFLSACASAPPAAPRKSAEPLPEGPTCYRINGPLLSPTPTGPVQWLVLEQAGSDAEGAEWLEGRAVVRGSAAQQVQWRPARAGSIRVRWGIRGGSMELRESGGNLSGNAESGSFRWRVRGVRAECTGVGS